MADDTRTRILNVAGPIFAEKGFQRATVREICDAAEVNVASVNYYFGDKEKLYIETVKRARQLKASQVPMPQRDSRQCPEEALHGFVRVMLTRMIGVQEAPWQFRLMMCEILRPTQACQEMVEEYFRPEFVMLLEILDEMLPEETPQHVRHQIGFSTVGQCLFYRVAGEVVAMLVPSEEHSQRYTPDLLADHISRMVLASLGRQSMVTSS